MEKIANLVLGLVGISRKVGPSLSDTARLFDKATSSIKIVSQRFHSKIYRSEEIVEAIEQALERGCAVEIIVGPEADMESIRFWDSRGVPIFRLDQWSTPDYAVVDGKHGRIEGSYKED